MIALAGSAESLCLAFYKLLPPGLDSRAFRKSSRSVQQIANRRSYHNAEEALLTCRSQVVKHSRLEYGQRSLLLHKNLTGHFQVAP